jgi:hypothetical protein
MQDLHAAGRDVQENEKGEKEKAQEGLAKKKNTFKRVNRGGGGNKTEGNKKAAEGRKRSLESSDMEINGGRNGGEEVQGDGALVPQKKTKLEGLADQPCEDQ